MTLNCNEHGLEVEFEVVMGEMDIGLPGIYTIDIMFHLHNN